MYVQHTKEKNVIAVGLPVNLNKIYNTKYIIHKYLS